MQIIGIADAGYNGTFIVTMKEDELCRLMGFGYTASDDYKRPSVGDEVNVHGMFALLRNIKSVGRDVGELQEKLRSAADGLEIPIPVLSMAAADKERVT